MAYENIEWSKFGATWVLRIEHLQTGRIWRCFLVLFSPFYQLLGGTPFLFLVFHGRYDTPGQLSVFTLTSSMLTQLILTVAVDFAPRSMHIANRKTKNVFV